MPIRPRNTNQAFSDTLDASHVDHVHTGADGSDQVAHSDTTGQTANDHHNELHTVASHSDTTATGAELETLTDGSDADSLHTHGAIQSQEEVEDIVGGMVSGNTETLIAVTYDDPNGKLDFVVDEASIDHGAIAGLADDDHTQYLNDTRHNGAHGAGRWRLGADQAVATSTETTVKYDTLVREDDPDGDFTMNLTTGVLTINNAGWYNVAGSLTWQGSSTGRRILNIRTSVGSILNHESTPVSSLGMAASTLIYLSAAETLWVTGFHTHGSDLNILAGVSTALSIVKVRE